MQLALSIRVTIAALAALALAQLLRLPLPLWAVLTAVIVTQMSVGRSLKATFDYLVGTLGGAIYGGAIAVLIPHSSEIALLMVLALAVAPLAFIAALNPRFSTAPITAIIVLLLPQITHGSPAASALDRVIEVALGGVTGSVVSVLLLPSNAHPLVIAAAARTLAQMARALSELLAGLTQGLDVESLHRIQDGIGQALVQMNVVGAEAEHERSAGLRVGPDTGPLLRTLLRLRHDIVMIGRAAVAPLPKPFRTRLEAPLARTGAAFADYLRASGAALLTHRGPPSFDSVDAALKSYSAEIDTLRREGLTRTLSGEDAERIFALGFALEQMHHNFKDLKRCVAGMGPEH
ncbi:MAG: FUSC family protein [Xanthobacteraceae bacterium]